MTVAAAVSVGIAPNHGRVAQRAPREVVVRPGVVEAELLGAAPALDRARPALLGQDQHADAHVSARHAARSVRWPSKPARPELGAEALDLVDLAQRALEGADHAIVEERLVEMPSRDQVERGVPAGRARDSRAVEAVAAADVAQRRRVAGPHARLGRAPEAPRPDAAAHPVGRRLEQLAAQVAADAPGQRIPERDLGRRLEGRIVELLVCHQRDVVAATGGTGVDDAIDGRVARAVEARDALEARQAHRRTAALALRAAHAVGRAQRVVHTFTVPAPTDANKRVHPPAWRAGPAPTGTVGACPRARPVRAAAMCSIARSRTSPSATRAGRRSRAGCAGPCCARTSARARAGRAARSRSSPRRARSARRVRAGRRS